MKIKKIGIIIISLSMMNINSFSQYVMPVETAEHEGTWLQWPHQYEYGLSYRNGLDATWVAMTKALVGGEKVHIIAYDNIEKNRIISLLNAASVTLTNVDFYIFPTNDVWVRDNGPIFVYDTNGNLLIEDWGFNGWGGKYNYNLDNPIPTNISSSISIPVINLNSIMTCEGGAVELDGNGVLMACKSSIISQSPANSVRNSGMTQSQAETILTQYLGVTKFIWLDGNVGDPYDITDFHIDGFAKFLNSDTLVTMSNSDLVYWGASTADISKLYGASNINNIIYTKIYLPLTQNNVVTTSGNNLGYKGSYVNYYVANNVVLVPNYNDPNDTTANAIVQGLYPDKTVVGINARNLYANGGMIHCVTQQQPIGQNTSSINTIKNSGIKVGDIYPNPTNDFSTMEINLQEKSSIEVIIFDIEGKMILTKNKICSSGKTKIVINTSRLKSGYYTYSIKVNNKNVKSSKLIVK